MAVYDITNFDTINAAALSGKACVIVSTIQALRINETARRVGKVEKARRRVYAHHEALDSHFAQLDDSHLADEGLEQDDKGEVKHSFANLMRIVRPAVIVDEAHNVVSELSLQDDPAFSPVLHFGVYGDTAQGVGRAANYRTWEKAQHIG